MIDTSWLPVLLFPLAALGIAGVIVWWTWPRKRPEDHDKPSQD